MPSHQTLYGNQSPPLFHRFWPRRPRTPETHPTPSNLEAQTQQPSGSETQPRASTSATVGTSASANQLSSSPDHSTMTPNTVQVSLLIAMPSAAQSRYEAYIAQSNPIPNKGAIPLPLPQLHPLADVNEKSSTNLTVPVAITTATEVIANATNGAEPTQNQVEAGSENKSSSPSDEKSHIHSRQSHRLSESSIAKGKMPELSLPHLHSHYHPHGQGRGVWSHLEEGEIPYMEFGVLEVIMEGQMSTDENEQQTTSSSANSGSSSSSR
jgi:hypothetical protein